MRHGDLPYLDKVMRLILVQDAAALMMEGFRSTYSWVSPHFRERFPEACLLSANASPELNLLGSGDDRVNLEWMHHRSSDMYIASVKIS